MNCFLTGVDTGIGKTYVASRWVRALRRAGRDVVGLKPICCGGREDAEALCAAAGGALDLNTVNPFWLRTPAAPYTAAMIENRSLDLELVLATIAQVRRQHAEVIVEGVGGWMVPLAVNYFLRDLARQIGLPVVIVVANRLGALNHALLTSEAVQSAGLPCAGFILNHPIPPAELESIAMATNRAMLEELSGLPVLFEVAHGTDAFDLPLR